MTAELWDAIRTEGGDVWGEEDDVPLVPLATDSEGDNGRQRETTGENRRPQDTTEASHRFWLQKLKVNLKTSNGRQRETLSIGVGMGMGTGIGMFMGYGCMGWHGCSLLGV